MKKVSVTVGKYVFDSLLALTAEEQAKGLMFQKWEPPIMAFSYKVASVNKFWMKNTPSPLDIVFSYKNKIINIEKGEPFSTRLIGNGSLSDLIVEFPSGYVEKYGIEIGQEIKVH